MYLDLCSCYRIVLVVENNFESGRRLRRRLSEAVPNVVFQQQKTSPQFRWGFSVQYETGPEIFRNSRSLSIDFVTVLIVLM